MTSTAHPLFEQPWPEGDYRYFQLGFLVDDLVDAATRWARAFGIGPFFVLPRVESTGMYRGTTTVNDVQIAVAQAGPVQIELIRQYCDRPSVYRDWLAGGHSRFHQLCTVTDDYDAKLAHFEGLGYELVAQLSHEGQRVGYFGTVEEFGFFTEVVENVPGFLDGMAGIARACARWDGNEPIRLVGQH